jgi:hypothetical protein
MAVRRNEMTFWGDTDYKQLAKTPAEKLKRDVRFDFPDMEQDEFDELWKKAMGIGWPTHAKVLSAFGTLASGDEASLVKLDAKKTPAEKLRDGLRDEYPNISDKAFSDVMKMAMRGWPSHERVRKLFREYVLIVLQEPKPETNEKGDEKSDVSACERIPVETEGEMYGPNSHKDTMANESANEIVAGFASSYEKKTGRRPTIGYVRGGTRLMTAEVQGLTMIRVRNLPEKIVLLTDPLFRA